MKKNHYAWWAWRIRLSFELYDVLRIDHFRGFEAYWEVPFGAPDAQGGAWTKGPDVDLFNELKRQLGELPIIAEDLGLMTQELIDMREKTGFPGMKVLQCGFNGERDAGDLPHNYKPNTVAYVGTHDNQVVAGTRIRQRLVSGNRLISICTVRRASR